MSLVKTFLFVLSILSVSFLGSSCSTPNNQAVNGLDANSAQPQRRPTRAPDAVKYFESVEEINKIKAVFAEKVGGELKVLYLNLDDNYAEIQAQNPQKPENVDQYSYRDDAFERVLPVKISGSGKLEDNLFNLKDVALEKIPELMRDAMERSKDLENPQPSSVRIELNHEGKVEIDLNVNSTRKNAFLVADAKGKFIRYTRY